MSTAAAPPVPRPITPSHAEPFEGALGRIPSLDILRGAVMVLMALDHVRVFSGIPPGGPTVGLFFTRWVTHFCAPAFFFLAGTGTFLHGAKLASRSALSKFLLTRGAWLILLELTVVRLGWTFNLDFSAYLLAGVIWALGWSMITLAALVHVPVALVAVVGGAIVAGHNLLDPSVQQLAQSLQGSSFAWLWQVLYFGGPFRIGGSGPTAVVLYSLIPWIGVMALGYAFGRVLGTEPARRTRLCLTIGLGACALFLLLRGFNLYGNPQPWGGPRSRMPALLSFLNTAKYPASLSFLLMTLGPTIALIPVLDRARGRIAGWLATFGRVPLFYYLLHIPLIHLAALGIAAVRSPEAIGWLFANHPMMMPPPPPGYIWSLPLLYAVTAGVVFTLYFPCRWFAGVKARRGGRWLSYV